MERLLITGFSGFVSRHLLEYLESEGGAAEVLGVSRTDPSFPLEAFPLLRCRFKRLDLLDKEGVLELLSSYRPTAIVHLASRRCC